MVTSRSSFNARSPSDAGHAHKYGCSCCTTINPFASTTQTTFDARAERVTLWDAVRLGASAILLASGLFLEYFFMGITPQYRDAFDMIFFGLPYVLCGYSVLFDAAKAMCKGDIFSEFTLISGATVAAIALDELPEAVGVMLLYSIGKLVQKRAIGTSRRSIKALLASRPTVAHVLDDTDTLQDCCPEDLSIGARVVVKPGERIPLDGEVIEGVSCTDTSPLTGESVPVRVDAGKKVYAGTINVEDALTIRVTALFSASSISRILAMVEYAAGRKAPTELWITRFARIYTPIVILFAVLVAVLPPMLGFGDWHEWIYRALVLVVISCPCALVISIPLGYFGGIGAASRRGLLIKGGVVLDALTRIRVVVSDALRPETPAALRALRAEGVERLVMLSGDTPENALRMAEGLGFDEVCAGLLPEGKVAALGDLGALEYSMFVGDGLNDAPCITAAGVGVAMGGLGSAAAIETADAVILDDSPAKLPELFRIAAKTRSIVHQNIVLSLGVKALVLLLGVAGISGLWEAVFADVGVVLLTVLNARAFYH